jgi:type IV pilus assembly protein PilV
MLIGERTMHKTSSLKPAQQQGVVMLEAMIAILLFSMSVLAIVGLQAAMIKNTADSKYRSDASYIAQERIGRIWADPDPSRAGYTSYVEANTDISALLPGGLRTVTQPAPGQFQITVGWTAPAETPAAGSLTPPCFMPVAHCFTTFAQITGG